MANIGGPLPTRRIPLMEGRNSVMRNLVRNARCKRPDLLVSVQRMAALRITLTYRTVSITAALVIASTISVDLLAVERMEVIIKHFKRNTISKWQRRWNDKDRRE